MWMGIGGLGSLVVVRLARAGLVHGCLVSEMEFISQVNYDESLWLKLRGERGHGTLFVGCVYMPTDSTSVSFLEECYSKLKDDVLSFREKGKVVLLARF